MSQTGLEYHKNCYKTYDEWQRDTSFHVINGEKAHKWDNDGVALFSNNQVEHDLEDVCDWSASYL